MTESVSREDRPAPRSTGEDTVDVEVAGPSLLQRAAAEALGDAILLLAIIGSSVAAANVNADPAVQGLVVGLSAALTLGLMVHLTAPVSGGHLNPAVSAASWWLRNRGEDGLDNKEFGAYVGAQVVGAIIGAFVANALFDLTVFTTSDIARDDGRFIFSEIIATLGLVLVVLSLLRTDRAASIPIGLFAWVLAAGSFTPSGAFANPAVAIGRMFTEAPTGIDPASVPGFVRAEFLGAALAVIVLYVLFSRRRTR